MRTSKQSQRVVTLGVLAVPVVMLVLWQLGSFIIGELSLPSPLKTIAVLKDGFFESKWLLSELKYTMMEILFGYLLAASVGLVFGFILGINRFLGDIAEPLVLNIYAIPKITLFPIFLLLFGLGFESKIAFGFFHGLFPIIIVTMSAIKDINKVHLKVGRSLKLSQLQIFKGIVFPSILPSLMTGLRLGFSLSFIGVILGEMSASRSGMGYILMKSEELFFMEKVLSVVLVLTFIAIGINCLFYLIEDRLQFKR